VPVSVYHACRMRAPGGGSPEPSCRYCLPGADGIQAGDPPADGDGPEPAWLAHLYLCRGLSTYAIAERAGVNRQRATRTLRTAGVALRPRGAGRLRPERRAGDPGLPHLMRALYEDARTRPDRGRGRTAPRRVGQHRVAQRPRAGRACPGRRRGPTVRAGRDRARQRPVRRSLVVATLTAHGIPRVPAGGPVSERFPVPVPLTTQLVKYWGCGVGLNHVEQLTGQAGDSVRGFMRRAGIPLRQPGGRSPFLRRWRAGPPGTSS
jgi:hypothetical protein